MTVNFRSAERRSFWAATAFGLVADFAIIVVIAFAFFRDGNAIWWGLWGTIALQLFLLVYALWGFVKRLIWFNLSEKDDRVLLIANEFNRHQFPRPDVYYNDADQYLTEVALSADVTPEGRLFAGSLLGALSSQRLNARTEAMLTALSIERAMQRMAPKQGHWD